MLAFKKPADAMAELLLNNQMTDGANNLTTCSGGAGTSVSKAKRETHCATALPLVLLLGTKGDARMVTATRPLLRHTNANAGEK